MENQFFFTIFLAKLNFKNLNLDCTDIGPPNVSSNPLRFRHQNLTQLWTVPLSNYRKPGKLWKTTKNYGKLQKTRKTRKTTENTENYGKHGKLRKTWKVTENYGKQRKHRKLRKTRKTTESPENYGKPRVSCTGILGFP